jgi:hypothetical protein
MGQPKLSFVPWISLVMTLTPCQPARCKEPGVADVSIATVSALLAGRYDNSEQVMQGKATTDAPAPQHVTITIEQTPKMDWELWRVHMDVDPVVAKAAGSATSLDAVWALNIARRAYDQSLSLIPYTLRPSVSASAVNASSFDETQWFSLEACMLSGEFGNARVLAEVAGDEMCVAEGMGLGGKRAFLPSRVEREGEWLHAQLIYAGNPWLVDARRVIANTAVR